MRYAGPGRPEDPEETRRIEAAKGLVKVDSEGGSSIMWDWIRRHGKALGAFAVAVGVTVQAALSGDGHVSGEEGFQIAVSAATALGVYLVPAVPQWPWMKTAQAALLAAVTAAGSYAIDGWSSADTMATALAFLGVLVVGALPAESDPHPAVRQMTRGI